MYVFKLSNRKVLVNHVIAVKTQQNLDNQSCSDTVESKKVLYKCQNKMNKVNFPFQNEGSDIELQTHGMITSGNESRIPP